MALFDKFAAAAGTRDMLGALPVNPTDIVIERVLSATEAMIGGRPTIMAGTNNYLGLTFDPACIEAGQRALAEAGTGTTGSRMANGTYREHLELERELAVFYDMPYAMVFSTGYSANLGSLVALLGPGDAVLLDSEAHASLFDGCRMSGADIFRFKHNDPDGLAKRLQRLGERARDALIVVEGLYSIRGDCAPLREYAAVKREHGGYLFVDEAHSLGVYGDGGRGLVEADDVLDQVDFVVGTFSKSLGSIGGFCVSPHEVLSLFRYASRPYIFTASPCPSVIATTRAALALIRERPELREKVWRNAEHLYAALAALGLTLGPHVSPVIGVSFNEREVALRCWQALLDAGVYTNLILPPAAPDGGSLIRVSVTAAHSEAQVERIATAFRDVIARYASGCAA
ncbi:MAG: aminotransferase class I/II-fold pyridoxal phosphate-dependent enzyme [Gammaproteobacteria bacterium]